MSLNYYTYDHTYDKPAIPDNISIVDAGMTGDGNFCSNIAFDNNAKFFYLSNYKIKDGYIDASCHFSVESSNVLINTWVSNLTACDNCSTVSGDTISDSFHYGNNDNISIYKNYSLEATNEKLIPVSDLSFNYYIHQLSIDISFQLKHRYNNSRSYWYYLVDINEEADPQYIFINEQASGINNSTKYNDYFINKALYDESLYQIKNNLYKLVNELANLEVLIHVQNVSFQRSYYYLNLLDQKIYIATKFFNNLMNKNSGALGLLDDTIYNSNTVMAENILMFVSIILSLYIYFKYIT